MKIGAAFFIHIWEREGDVHECIMTLFDSRNPITLDIYDSRMTQAIILLTDCAEAEGRINNGRMAKGQYDLGLY
ncbi:MAG TPA: hypothetical protein DCL77_01610 [Prolixibacteraceae bacterium]|jgi:hypothetical protein|nr:hypothetical protein [Prolixibacteraceae bacterium]